VVDDFSRYALAWKLCTTMTAADVTEALRLAFASSNTRPSRAVGLVRRTGDRGSPCIPWVVVKTFLTASHRIWRSWERWGGERESSTLGA